MSGNQVPPGGPERGSVAVHAPTLALFLAASAAPSPLYPLYEHRWGFSPLMLTVVFSVYSLALLASLLIAGGVSDQLGRRPVILAAIAGEVVAMSGLLFAHGVGWLVAARIVQGLATGLAVSAVGAAILDADHRRGPLLNAVVPMIGMGVGGFGSGLLVHLAPMPFRTVYLVLIALLLVQAVITWTGEEPVDEPSRALHLRPRIVVPPQARAALLAASPAAIALWMTGGFSLSLLPSLLARVLPGSGALLGGSSVAVVTMTAAGAILAIRNRAPRLSLPLGSFLLLSGVAILLGGAHAGSVGMMLAGTAVLGTGFGAGWFGAVRSVLPLALPTERAGLMSAFYLECYLANSIPVILAGEAVRRIGLLPTVDRFGGAIILLAAVAIASSMLRGGSRPPAPCDAAPVRSNAV